MLQDSDRKSVDAATSTDGGGGGDLRKIVQDENRNTSIGGERKKKRKKETAKCSALTLSFFPRRRYGHYPNFQDQRGPGKREMC
jgi:hypothetical protein